MNPSQTDKIDVGHVYLGYKTQAEGKTALLQHSLSNIVVTAVNEKQESCSTSSLTNAHYVGFDSVMTPSCNSMLKQFDRISHIGN